MLILIREMGKAAIPHSDIRTVRKHPSADHMVLSLAVGRVFIAGYHPELILWHRNPDSLLTIRAEYRMQV